jgi:hypothetical protein
MLSKTGAEIDRRKAGLMRGDNTPPCENVKSFKQRAATPSVGYPGKNARENMMETNVALGGYLENKICVANKI